MAEIQQADGGGLRYNAGKNQVELLPPEWIWGLAMVTTRGSIKYVARNWERGMAWATVVGCVIRHTLKFVCGERYDEETGCHHMAMAAWNCLALMTYDIRKIGENNMVGNLDWLTQVAIAPGPVLQKIMDDKVAAAAVASKAPPAFQAAATIVVRDNSDPEGGIPGRV